MLHLHTLPLASEHHFMFAVVYSGARHADWRLIEKGKVLTEFKTKGINPFFHDEKYITQLLNKTNDLVNYAEAIKKIFFFGAGATIPERKETISTSLALFFRYAKIFVEHDLQAAALACANDERAIICVIGSGSNATYFDGKKTIDNNFGLGYLLGDEGSANWLGRIILRDWLYERIPKDFLALLKETHDYDRNLILERVYKQPNPEQFLCSFVDILMEHRTHTYVQSLIKNGFNIFLNTYVKSLQKRHGSTLPIHFVGTVAANFQDYLREIATTKNITITTVTKEPIYNLVNYYANKIH